MENQESKSSWDDLARDLGAEISPEVQHREEAVAAAKPQAAPASRIRETPAPLPKRTATDWNSLVTDLGLPPLEEPEPIAAAPSIKPEVPKVVTRTEPTRDREAEQARGRRPERPDRDRGDRERPPRRGGREQSRRRRERPEQGREQFEPRHEDAETSREELEPRRERAEQSREPSEHRRGGRGRRGGQGQSRGRRDGQGEGGRDRGRTYSDEQDRERGWEEEREREQEREVRPEPDVQETAAEPTPPREPQQKPAAVSLWHKIFGSPAEQTAKIVDEPVDEVGSPSDLRNEPRAAGSGFSDAHPDDQLEMFDETVEETRSVDSEDATEEEVRSDRPRGRSRRRGRGRGRGRRPDDRQSEGRVPRQRSDESRVERSQPDLEDEFSDEELMEVTEPEGSVDDGDDANGVATGAGISRSAALQRSIPSWDEAIGFIVDANMQSRSQRRPPSRSGGSRDNGSRGGRGRGRRKS